MSEVHVIAQLFPKPDKVERFKELIGTLAKAVHEKEDYTSRYLTTEKLGAAEPEFIIVETYKDKASADKHATEPHFKEFFKQVGEEGIMAKAPYIIQTKSVKGFDNNRALL